MSRRRLSKAPVRQSRRHHSLDCTRLIRIEGLFAALSTTLCIKRFTLRDVETLPSPHFDTSHIICPHLRYLELDTPSLSTVIVQLLQRMRAPALHVLILGEYWMEEDPKRTRLQAVGSGVSGYSEINWVDVERAANSDPDTDAPRFHFTQINANTGPRKLHAQRAGMFAG